MPNYTYKCKRCGKEIKLLRGYSERNSDVMCDCGAVAEFYFNPSSVGLRFNCDCYTNQRKHEIGDQKYREKHGRA